MEFVGVVAEQCVSVEIDEHASMVCGGREVEWLIADSGDSWAEFATDKSVVDSFRSADICAGFVMLGEFLFPNVEELALLAYLLQTGIVIQDVFVEVACEYD